MPSREPETEGDGEPVNSLHDPSHDGDQFAGLKNPGRAADEPQPVEDFHDGEVGLGAPIKFGIGV